MNNFLTVSYAATAAETANFTKTFALPVDATLISATVIVTAPDTAAEDAISIEVDSETIAAVMLAADITNVSAPYISSDQTTVDLGYPDPVNSKFIPAGTPFTLRYTADLGLVTRIVILFAT